MESSSDESETSDEDAAEEVSDVEADEVDQSNIITTGRRTRGKKVDYAAAFERDKDSGIYDEEDDGQSIDRSILFCVLCTAALLV